LEEKREDARGEKFWWGGEDFRSHSGEKVQRGEKKTNFKI